MPDSPCKFFLTTPIYYVNARPHIGHAYTTIVADVLARRARAQGVPTWFLTGTDEHGQKIERSAQAAGIPPQQFADEVSASFRTLWQRMGITNDQFIRTTDPAHKRGVQKLFADLHARGQIYLSSYTGQYSVGEEMFVEGPPGTIGPDGRPTETVTEENFFFRLSDYQLPLLDLIESDTLKITPEARKNEVLSFLRGPIQALEREGEVTVMVDKEVRASGEHSVLDLLSGTEYVTVREASLTKAGTTYVDRAVRNLSISRSSFTWGIPVPEEILAKERAKQKHVIYVWLDALANYMTAVGYGSEAPEDQAKFAKYWPADLHLVGKEIIRFHCVYWPAFLLAAGLRLPKAVTAHGWLLFDDSKMSKSKGNIVRTETILEAFGTLCPTPHAKEDDHARNHVILSGAKDPCISLEAPRSPLQEENIASPSAIPTPHQRDLFAADVLRYFLLREIPFGQDGSFSFEALITRYNADLANGYGNLVSRTLTMIQQYSDGAVPPHRNWGETRFLLNIDGKNEFFVVPDALLAEDAKAACIAYGTAFTSLQFTLPLSVELSKSTTGGVTDSAMYLINQTDKLLTRYGPWKLAKSGDENDHQTLREVLYTAAESIRIITALLHPIIPYATAAVWSQLGLGSIEQAAKNGELKTLTWGGLKPGTKLGPLSPIFPRADKGLAQIMADIETQKDQATVTAQNVVPETTTDPAAGPRTASFTEPNPGQQVAGSTAHTTERTGTPSHHEAASGIFAGQLADASPQITIDDFAKVELRVAQILVCERIPKADKLLRLEVDLGYERRQILSGIAEWYTPEELVGRRIVVITNLAPRKMRGLESHGMLLAASTEGGKPYLATFTGSEDLPLGSRLK